MRSQISAGGRERISSARKSAAVSAAPNGAGRDRRAHPREHRVAALAADGHSNREIAQRLYITQRTVETHLTHAFQKLDIASRAELARGFADHDQHDATPTPAPPIPAG
jgi:DNA-binding CsgD family transcriptional regulator